MTERAIDPLSAAVAKALHREWCELGTCSWGVEEWPAAVRIAAAVREHLTATPRETDEMPEEGDQ